MALTGVDISHHQNDAGLDLAKLLPAVGFVIIKATQGTGYVDPAFARNMAAARAAGKLRGSYHFAGDTGRVPGDPVREADHFAAVAGPQPGEVLVLDWEPTKAPADPDGWCAAFIARVLERTGVAPMIYMSESVARSGSWARTRALDVGLWVARYGPNTGSKPAITLNVGSWGRAAMWQFTSAGRRPGATGLVDCNEFYGDATAWLAYGGGSTRAPALVAPPRPVAQPQAAPAFDVARDFRCEKGDRSDRIRSLQKFLNRVFPAYSRIAPTDPTYGPQTVAVVREFAHRSGIPSADGLNIGPQIAAALAKAGFRG